jgi:hypothetical protein
MVGSGGLDIRLPIGGLFTLLGLVLAAYGFATAGDSGHYERSQSINVNLWWGMVMLAFGAGLLLSATFYRRRATVHLAAETREGKATEARERQLGLEGDAGK